ncbi:Alpha-1B adrenergic receptor [Holothuria leucospilota]|uniref:Alpha-1B adrenergic receptor n=1 Tax=Holothuria leucospilota TaxID=206669 RepID=A0A9Q0YPV7_HOLLE|nr:Alpha-1B adrenergic receptor [Holothuria leucospilota]
MNSSQESSNIKEVTVGLKVFVTLLTVPLSSIGAFGNLVVIAVVIKKRSLRTASNIFTVTLMGVSLVLCCHSYPLQLMIDLYFFTRQPWCFIVGSQLLAVSIHLSMCLLLTTVERYITICRPLQKDVILTPRKVILLVTAVLIYGGMIGTLGGLFWIGKGDLWHSSRRCNFSFIVPSRVFALFLISNWLLPIPIMTMMYFHIFIVVRRHIREIAALLPRDTNTTDAPEAFYPRPVPAISRTRSLEAAARQGSIRIQNVFKKKMKGRVMREAKSAFLLFVVVAVYIFNWVPFVIFLLTGVLSAENVPPEQYVLLHAFVYSCGVIAPYLYGFGNRKFRRSIQAMLLPRCCSTTENAEDTLQTISSREGGPM